MLDTERHRRQTMTRVFARKNAKPKYELVLEDKVESLSAPQVHENVCDQDKIVYLMKWRNLQKLEVMKARLLMLKVSAVRPRGGRLAAGGPAPPAPSRAAPPALLNSSCVAGSGRLTGAHLPPV